MTASINFAHYQKLGSGFRAPPNHFLFMMVTAMMATMTTTMMTTTMTMTTVTMAAMTKKPKSAAFSRKNAVFSGVEVSEMLLALLTVGRLS